MKENKRLTKKGENGQWCIDGNLVNQRQDACFVFADALELVINRLAELEDKIENGTLIELPCKVGGRVYKIMKVAGVERIAEYVVMDFSYGIHGNFIKANSLQGNAKTITFREFYDFWFLTKAEAEAKLKELQNER